MDARGRAGRLVAGLTVSILLAGCAAGASPTPLPASPTQASMSPGASATPTPTPTPAGPLTYGPVTVVTGTATCPGMSWDFTTDPDGTQHVRDDYHADRCTVETGDPRVSGVRSSTWNIDLWGDANAGEWALVQWGTQRLENAGGAWEGRATGIGSSDRGDVIVNWYKGTGGYAGLSYFELWTGDGPWTIEGQIFPGNPPTP